MTEIAGSLETRLLINGERMAGAGTPLEVFNPFTGEKVIDIPSANRDQVDAAVRAATEAFPAWRATPPGERARMLGELAAHIEAEGDTYAALECLNTGKPYFITRNFADVPTAVESIRFLSQNARSLSVPAANEYIPGHLSMVRREPVGVCALNPPWNYPLMISSIILSAALASGNTVVLKPADPTPLSLLKLADAINAIFPKGVFNLVIGAGADVGSMLAAHPGVDMFQVTGSTETGKAVLGLATGNVKRTHLELGGKAPVIISEHADVEAAVAELRMGSFANAGQDCTQACRIYAHKKVYDRFVSAFADMANSIGYASDNDEENEMAPLFTRRHLDRVAQAVERAVALPHTELVAGGKAGPRGFFHEPTVIANALQDDDIVRNEVFGPVVSITPVDDMEQAVAWANDCEFGLASSIFSRDINEALSIVPQLRFGVTWVNTHFPMTAEMPHAGMKQSGYGSDGSIFSIEDYTIPRHVMIKFANEEQG